MKNIPWTTLLTSKTFWGALTLWATTVGHAYGQWQAGAKAQALSEVLGATGALILAIGIKDATSGPVN